MQRYATFDTEKPLGSSYIKKEMQFVRGESARDNSSNVPQNCAATEKESQATLSDKKSATTSSDWLSDCGTRRGRKMVLVAVLDKEPTHCTEFPNASKSAPSSPLPLPPLTKPVVSVDSLRCRREVFRKTSILRPQPAPLSRRSYSDSHSPDRRPESPVQLNTLSFDHHLCKRAKLPFSSIIHRSFSWSSDEEVSNHSIRGSSDEILLPIVSNLKGPMKASIQQTSTAKTGTDWEIKATIQGQTEGNVYGRYLPSRIKLQSQHENKLFPPDLAAKLAPRIQSADLMHGKVSGTIDDLPRQLAKEIYNLTIPQIEGFADIYKAIQFSPSILSHAVVFCRTFQFFCRTGVKCHVDIGYRYFVNEKEYRPEKNILPGICTFNDPFAFYPHEHMGNVRGQLVARLAGRMLTATKTIAHLKPFDAATYTSVEMPLQRSTVQILSSVDQCLPLLHFDSKVVLDLYDNESTGNLVLHTYHQRLQRELDRVFNDGVTTKVPFHLPSEHPDFQPI